MAQNLLARRRSPQAAIRAQAMHTELLTREEEVRLARAWIGSADRKARDTLVLAHQKLVLGMVRKFERHGIPFDDLFDEGVFALMIAVDKFDPETGNRFATYAQWWVLTYLQEFVQREICPVRIGRTRREKTIVRELAKARRKHGSVIDETVRGTIAANVGVGIHDVHLIEAALASRSLSLNHTVGGEGEGHLEFVDQLADEDEGEEKVLKGHLDAAQIRVIDEILLQLDDRGRFIIKERHLSETPRTLRELADELQLSSERVRQIELESIQRLKRALLRAGYKARDLIGAA
jgi:RNA polymerase sigma-32 factor